MDRNAPPALTDTPQRGYDESKALLHEMARPRPARLRDHAALRDHLDRGAIGSRRRARARISRRARADPLEREPRRDRLGEGAASRKRATISTFTSAPGWSARNRCSAIASIWSRARSLRLAEHRGVAAFCPTSNLFLGSGLFDEAGLDAAGVRVALATDVGGGTSYSLLQTANEAYKVLQMRRQSWPALQAFYQLTLGNARALGLEDKIGALEAGLRGRSRRARFARDAGDGASHGVDRRRSRGGTVRADDDGRRSGGRRRLMWRGSGRSPVEWREVRAQEVAAKPNLCPPRPSPTRGEEVHGASVLQPNLRSLRLNLAPMGTSPGMRAGRCSSHHLRCHPRRTRTQTDLSRQPMYRPT